MKYVYITIVILGLLALIFLGWGLSRGAKTIDQLLTKNKALKQAISNLTVEEQIGYAKVVKQEIDENGKLFTTILFVETARNDKLKKVLEHEYIVEGDIIHFDALIVSFDNYLVSNGKRKALYLWRRIYSDSMPPEDGFAIESKGKEPKRYAQFLKLLDQKERQLFWQEIWKLADNPDALKNYHIKAIYGNVVYKKMQPGFVYIFKIDGKGQVYPETIIDI